MWHPIVTVFDGSSMSRRREREKRYMRPVASGLGAPGQALFVTAKHDKSEILHRKAGLQRMGAQRKGVLSRSHNIDEALGRV
jgi:hypothetical protein